jgi:hypothetical protein
MLGLTRDNLSASALGIGIAIGCGAGAVVVPWLLPLVDDSAAHKSMAGLNLAQPLQPSSPQQQQPGASVANDTDSLGAAAAAICCCPELFSLFLLSPLKARNFAGVSSRSRSS